MHALPDSSSTPQGASVHLVSGDLFGPLEAQLSPHAQHAFQAYLIAIWQPDQTMTVRELRNAIRLIYGDAVDREIEQHMHDRREAVLPNAASEPRGKAASHSP